MVKNGEPAGPALEIVLELCKRIKVAPEFQVLPWRRALKYAREGKVNGVFAARRTEERVGFLYYPSEPLHIEKTVIMALEGSGIKADGHDALKGRLTGIVRGYFYGPEFDKYKGLKKLVCDDDRQILNIQTLLRIERALLPAKITDINIPAFIVPIKPEWAMSLFDSEIASQDLFGAIKPDLMFNTENVYYRSSRPKVLSAPSRILWYVTKGGYQYQGTMSIRASSYLDEVVIDKPKPLYSRFQGLGIYQWKDVFELAGKNLHQKIMGFQFSNTEMFNNPIFTDRLKEISLKTYGKNFYPPQSPVSVSNSFFFHLYKMGLGYSDLPE